MTTDKNFRRVHITVDDEVFSTLGLSPDNITAISVRRHLKILARVIEASFTEDELRKLLCIHESDELP